MRAMPEILFGRASPDFLNAWCKEAGSLASAAAATGQLQLLCKALERTILISCNNHTLKRKFMMSPSFTTYSLPSRRSLPLSRAFAVLPASVKSAICHSLRPDEAFLKIRVNHARRLRRCHACLNGPCSRFFLTWQPRTPCHCNAKILPLAMLLKLESWTTLLS